MCTPFCVSIRRNEMKKCRHQEKINKVHVAVKKRHDSVEHLADYLHFVLYYLQKKISIFLNTNFIIIA